MRRQKCSAQVVNKILTSYMSCEETEEAGGLVFKVLQEPSIPQDRSQGVGGCVIPSVSFRAVELNTSITVFFAD